MEELKCLSIVSEAENIYAFCNLRWLVGKYCEIFEQNQEVSFGVSFDENEGSVETKLLK